TLVRGADQVTFRYVGVDRALRLTHIAFSPDGEVEPAGADGVGASVGIRWSVTIQPGESREISWTVWSSEHALPGTGRTADSLGADGASGAVDASCPNERRC